MKLKAILQVFNWFADTPKRAIDRAYQAALKIEAIENRYFSGEKIVLGSSEYSDRVVDYFEREIKKYLKIVKIRLREFQTSRSLLELSQITLGQPEVGNLSSYLDDSNFIQRLELIERILNKYSDSPPQEYRSVSQPEITDSSNKDSTAIAKLEKVSDKTGILPRSFIRTLDRIADDITPDSPEKKGRILQDYRKSKQKTIISLRFLMLLIVLPFVTYQISKTFLARPIVESYFAPKESVIFTDEYLEEKAFQELEHFEAQLHFRSLAGMTPEISPAETEIQLKQKVAEIIEKYRQRSIDAIANIFADLFSLLSFTLILLNSQREIAILKSFLDSLIYGLSDSAKAFLIILSTDIFVGYHSTHGWEIVLEHITKHFGLPESREFIFLFIATFPVILDTIFKYWIFRYLNRISPSAVATYKEMND